MNLAASSIDKIVSGSRWATTIGAICDSHGGEIQTGPFGSQLHASDYTDDGTPVVMPRDMQDGAIVCDRIARIPQRHVQRLHQHVLLDGDVVYSRRGDVTRFAVVTSREQGWLCGTGSIRIRLNCSDLEIGYVRQYLRQEAVGAWLEHNAKGVTMANLNTSIVRALPFVYPPLAEQRRIAEVLDRAEALRTKRRAALAQLDTLAESIFAHFYAETRSVSRDVPLCSLAEANRGSFVNGPFGSDLLTTELTQEGVPVVYIRDIRDGEYRRVSAACITAEKAKALAVCSVHPGDVLIAKVGDPPGIAAVYPEDQPVAVVTQDVVRVRVARDTVLPIYLARYLNSEFGKRNVAGITIEATRARFSLGDFKKLRIGLPPLPMQRQLARRIAAVEKLKSAQRASLAELDALFASLQHRAFRGEL